MFEPYAHGFLHRSVAASRGAVVLTHGAGSNSRAPLLVAVAEELAGQGWTVFRFDLPFRRRRASGPPHPSTSAQDREGIHEAAILVRGEFPGELILGGQSYGGRQTTMLAAEQPQLANGLLLLSYPLHPPGKPTQLRTEHFPSIRAKAAFVHGARDSFGSPEEMRTALAFIPAVTSLHIIEGAGHDLGRPPAKAATRIGTVVREVFG